MLRRPIASPARRGTRAHGTRPVLADPARGAVPTVRGVTRITRRPSGPERRRRREHSADALEAFRKLRVVAGGLGETPPRGGRRGRGGPPSATTKKCQQRATNDPKTCSL